MKNAMNAMFFAVMAAILAAGTVFGQETLFQLPVEKSSTQLLQEMQKPREKTITVAGVRLFQPLPTEKSVVDDEHMISALQMILTGPNADRFRADYGQLPTRQEQEALVLLYKPDAATATVTRRLFKPDEVTIINDPALVLEPGDWRVFHRWNVDPILNREKQTSENRITQISDLKRFLPLINSRIDQTSYPAEIKDEWKTVLENCIDGLTGEYAGYCKEVVVSEWAQYWELMLGGRSHAAKVHYVPDPEWRDAKAVAMFLPKAGMWVAQGFACWGNPFVPYQSHRFDVTKTEVQPIPGFGCKISQDKSVLSSRTDSAAFKLSVFSDSTPIKMDFTSPYSSVDWYLDARLMTRNVMNVEVFGSDLGAPGGPYRVLARVTIGKQQVECYGDLMYKELPPVVPPKVVIPPPTPIVPPPVVTPPPKPECPECKHKVWPWILGAAVAGGAVCGITYAAHVAPCGHEEKVTPTKTPIGPGQIMGSSATTITPSVFIDPRTRTKAFGFKVRF